MKQLQRKHIFISAFMLFLALVICNPLLVSADLIGEHKIYSNKVCTKRIKKIQDYYYNKNDELTSVKIKWSYFSEGEMTFYFHGKDLLFGYGTDQDKREYRAYFYRGQLIRLLLDEKGQKRKTCQHRFSNEYINFENLEESMLFFWIEAYGREELSKKYKTKSEVISGRPVMVTKVSGNTIYYHKLYCVGPDGCVASIGKTRYKAKLKKDALILEAMDPNGSYRRHSKAWLKDICEDGLGFETVLEKSGTEVSEMRSLYSP